VFGTPIAKAKSRSATTPGFQANLWLLFLHRPILSGSALLSAACTP